MNNKDNLCINIFTRFSMKFECNWNNENYLFANDLQDRIARVNVIHRSSIANLLFLIDNALFRIKEKKKMYRL